MNVVEVKKSVADMTVEERLEIAAYIAHLNKADDVAYGAELDRRIEAMEAGHKVRAEAFEATHARLSEQKL